MRGTKRACRRRVASGSTVCRVPAETWVIVCTNLFFSPHTVFRLMMACKGLWRTLDKDDAWWAAFMQRVMRYQECLEHSNIRHRLVQLTDRLKYGPQRALRLVCSPRCCTCGARFGHFIFRPLRARICSQCLQGVLVSNRVLALRYGLDVVDFIVAYIAAAGVFIPLDYYQHRNRLTHMARLSRDPVDHLGRSPVMFLLRSDVERVTGVRLDPDALVAQRGRIAAVHLLAACARRALVRSRLLAATTSGPAHMRMHRVRCALLDLANNELHRSISPITVPDGFVLGGPFCAWARHSQVRRSHLSVDTVNTASRNMYAPLGFAVGGSSNLWM